MDAPRPYGADDFVLICGWRFNPDRPPHAIGSLAADGVLDAAPGSFVWIHVNLGHAGAQRWLRTHAPLGKSFFEASSSGSRSTRIERDGDALDDIEDEVLAGHHARHSVQMAGLRRLMVR